MEIMRKFNQQQKQCGGVDDGVQGREPPSCHTNYKYNDNTTTDNNENNNNNYGLPEVPIVENNCQDTTRIQELIQTQKLSEITTGTTTLAVTITLPCELRRRRRECLDRFEERIKRALLKNLEHLSLVEEERLRKNILKVDEVKTLEQQIDDCYNQRLQSRQKLRMNDNKNDINTSAAGIGTKKRNQAEKKRKRNALPASLNNEKNRSCGGDNIVNNSRSNSTSSVAIYLSNLPKDGSADEDVIKSLFGSYGSIRKIHFYVDKVCGKKKGDALVIYSLQEGEDEALLMDSVCSQVNGCELPGGTILSVQPSDPFHKAKSSTASSYTEQQIPSAVVANEHDIEKINGYECGGNDEEDLDDFFASLE
mmetsp:Transcript_24029/g.26799  ORF Transcript_24029/g.26799 Transcript_24029/m.26799 type:complete len:365 (-) Transcript_24029:102-1196(-)